MNCKKCNATISSKYCPDCGQPINLKRIDSKYIIHEIEHILHFERGIFYTIKELVINPGKNIRNYLSENRSRLVKPIIFIILTSLIYSLISKYFRTEDSYANTDNLKNSAIGVILNWVQNNYGYASILLGVFLAIWLKIFYKKFDYNFYELLIMLCFVQGISMLIYAVFALAEGLFHYSLIGIAGLVSTAYITWAFGNFFEAKKILSYGKALLALVLGFISFYTILMAIGLSIDLVNKQH